MIITKLNDKPAKIITKICPKHNIEFVESELDEKGMTIATGICPICEKEHRIKRTIQMSAIPLRFENRTFENYLIENEGQQKALDKIKKFAQSVCKNPRGAQTLILMGWPGTGKTHLGCAAARYVIEHKNLTAIYTSTFKIIMRVRASWKNPTETEEEIYRKLAKVDLLVIDEVGVQNGTDNEKNIIFNVINARYEKKKPIILISNLDIDGIIDFIGERAYDRIKEAGYGVNCEWESYRNKKFKVLDV